MRREYERALMKRLSEMRLGKLEQLGAGGLDIEAYRYWTGYLKAFEDFIAVLEECKKRETEDNG
jgi:hypothetical protein